MIIVEKDKHTKEKEPFFSALKEYHKWFILQSFNSENNTFISLGDEFHSAFPTPKEYDEIERFHLENKFKKIYLLAGNHDYSDIKKSYSILPLKNNPRIELILEPCQKVIEGKVFLFLPYYMNMEGYPSMKEYYSNLPEEFRNNDYIVYHFDDETIRFGKHKTGIDLSYLKGKRIGGHIHLSQKNYELGMPVQSRFDEKGQENNLLCISDKDEFISIPKFLDYYEVEYGQDLSKVEAMFPIWDVLNAPSSKLARKFYKEKNPNTFIREVFVKNEKEDNIENKQEKGKTVLEYFNNYIIKREDISEWAKDRLKNIISKR